MLTGIKKLDFFIEKYGIQAKLVDNPFQSSIQLSSSDYKNTSLRLPFCFCQILERCESNILTMHRFKLPHRNELLAAFLVNPKGDIVEQVFYQNKRGYVDACKKIEAALLVETKSLAQLVA